MKLAKINNQSGLTVVELIIAMVIGLILLGSLSSIVISQTGLSEGAKDQTLANSFAETKIEQLRSEGFNSLTSSATPVDISSEMPDDLSPPKSASYTVTDASQDGIKIIDLTINFRSRGSDKTLKYRTYIGELGVGQY